MLLRKVLGEAGRKIVVRNLHGELEKRVIGDGAATALATLDSVAEDSSEQLVNNARVVLQVLRVDPPPIILGLCAKLLGLHKDLRVEFVLQR